MADEWHKQIDGAAVDEVLRIATASFPRVWSKGEFLHFLEHPCRLTLGVGVGTSLRAYLLALLVHGELDIVSIATDPAWHRRGYAQSLISACQKDPRVQKIALEVDFENIPAIALYRRCDFATVNVRKAYYENTRDAYLMTWERTPSSP